MGFAKALLVTALTLAVSPVEARPKVGDQAPMFTIEAALAGRTIQFSLADALTRGPVVLFFYPKSFTSVCTEEARLFAEAMDEFTAAGASVIGISSDRIETQREFSSLECRDKFPVGADPTLTVIKQYDVAFGLSVAKLPFADRVSFVIAPDGRILSSVKDSGAEAHIRKSLEVVKTWRAG